MDEKDVRISNLRAQVAGQEQTIMDQMEQIRDLQDKLAQKTERIQELIAGIQTIIDRERGARKG